MVFVMCEMQMNETEQGAIECNSEMSSGHFVRMYMFRKIVNIICEWSHTYDESEWSLKTSVICRF